MKQKIIIGCANFGNRYGFIKKKKNIESVKRIASIAIKNKITHFDTAQDYKNSEKILGQVIKEYKGTKFNIDTKLTKFLGKIDYAKIEHKVRESLKKLNIKKINTLYIHDPSQLKGRQGKVLFASMLKLKKKKLFKYIGVSVYSISETKQILKKFPVNIIQAPVNFLDRRFLDINLIKLLKKRKAKLIARSVFLKGVLVKGSKHLPKKLMVFKNVQQFINKLAKENKTDKIAVCFASVLRIKVINKVIVGVSSSNQLKKLIEISKNRQNFSNFIAPHIANRKLLDPRYWKLH